MTGHSAGWRIVCYACLALAIGVLVADVAVACPTCKDGLAENDPAGQAIAAGYFWSILFMMSMPFLLVGSFISYAYFTIQKAQKQAAADSTTDGLAGSQAHPS